MNDKMLDLIGLADEEYLTEAQSLPERRITRRRFSAGVIAAAAAAAVMTVTAGAVTIAKLIHKESVDYYYNEQMASEMEERGYAVGQVSENEHVRMTLENMLVDENYAYGVVTVECLDEAGDKAFRNVPEAYMIDENGKNLSDYGIDSPSAMLGIFTSPINRNNEKRAYMLQLYLRDPYAEERTELPEKVTVQFSKKFINSVSSVSDLPKDELDGISFEVSLLPNTKSVKLISESGHKGVISEFMYDFIYMRRNVSSADYAGTPNVMVLNFENGESRTLNGQGAVSSVDSINISPEAAAEDPEDECDVRGRFEQLTDITGLKSVEFAGETYNVVS